MVDKTDKTFFFLEMRGIPYFSSEDILGRDVYKFSLPGCRLLAVRAYSVDLSSSANVTRKPAVLCGKLTALEATRAVYVSHSKEVVPEGPDQWIVYY